MTRLHQLQNAGVSIWLDTLSRELLESGEFGELVRDYAVTGATSNPTIFAKAITGSSRYDEQLRAALATGVTDTQELFFEVALEDVRRAAELLRPIHAAAAGRDGFVSFECTPDLADDTEATIAQARDLWRRLDLPNVMIKVPATEAGVPAIEELTADGINVNVTLLFSVERYDQVIEAYLRGLERRAEAGKPIDGIASVASFFLSRIDTKVDAELPAGSDLRGRVAIANARVAYARYEAKFSGAAWEALRRAGARPQRPLWASTGTKDAELLGRALRQRARRPRRGQHHACDRPCARSPTTGRWHAPWTPTPRRPGTSSPPRGGRASHSIASPPSSSARVYGPSATPTANCSTASTAS